MAHNHILVREETGNAIRRGAKENGMRIMDYVQYLVESVEGETTGTEQIPPLNDDERAQINELVELQEHNETTTISVSKLTGLLLQFLVKPERMGGTKWSVVHSLVVQKMKDIAEQ